MNSTLALQPRSLEKYLPFAGEASIGEIRRLAQPLEGLRVLHVSATAFGTGVAELLGASVPLLADLGLDCHWQVVRPAEESATASKALYRALAGLKSTWSDELGETWMRYSAMNAALFTESFDVIVVHDPQPAALRTYMPDSSRSRTRWVLHSHLDLSSADPDAWRLLRQHIDPYDAIVFDANDFVHPDLSSTPVTIIRPAIDPLGPRNMELSDELVRTILVRYGIDPERPLLSQMSPCDPGSDLLGAIDVNELVGRVVPGTQLVLVAMHAPEDSDCIAYFDETVRKSMDHSDVHILRGVCEVGNVEANAIQRASDVVIQKGLRKGFGLWISDAQWKGRPVVTASDGGLAQQVEDGKTGFLAESTEDFADRVSQVLKDPALAARMGKAGHEHVAKQFLLTRFIADELRLIADVIRGRS